MKEIILKHYQKSILVDDEDYEWLISLGKWYLTHNPNIYKYRSFYPCVKINGKHIKMHKLIINKYYNKINGLPDHKDGNTLNNQKNNLRIASFAQNTYNRVKKKSSKSMYKGVSFCKRHKNKPWESTIQKDGKRYFLGNYMTQKEAGIAYNIKALEFFGEFAKLNIID